MSTVVAQQFDGHFVELNEMCKCYFVELNVNALRSLYRLTANTSLLLLLNFLCIF